MFPVPSALNIMDRLQKEIIFLAFMAKDYLSNITKNEGKFLTFGIPNDNRFGRKRSLPKKLISDNMLK